MRVEIKFTGSPEHIQKASSEFYEATWDAVSGIMNILIDHEEPVNQMAAVTLIPLLAISAQLISAMIKAEKRTFFIDKYLINLVKEIDKSNETGKDIIL